VGHNVHHIFFGAPVALVDVVTILGDTAQVDNPEIGALRRHIRGGFAQIVKSRPDKLAGNVLALLLPHKVVVGDLSP